MGWQTNNGKVAKEYADYAKKQADLLAEKQDGLDEIIEVGEFVKGNRVNIEKAITDSTEAKGKSTEAKTTADSVKSQFDRVVAEAGSNNPEVVQARGNEVNLNARFEKVTTQLAEMPTKEYLEERIVEINHGGEIDLSHKASVDYVEQLNGISDLTTVPIREDGVVVAIEERRGETVISRITINRDANGEVLSTSKTVNGKTVTSIYNKENGQLVSVTKTIQGGGE